MSEPRKMHPDGFMCLACETRTKNEGQLCSACVEKGHRVENDTLHLNLTPFLMPKRGTTWTLFKPIPDGDKFS